MQQNVEGNEGGRENPQREMWVHSCQGEKEGLRLRLKESLGQSRLSDDLPREQPVGGVASAHLGSEGDLWGIRQSCSPQ